MTLGAVLAKRLTAVETTKERWCEAEINRIAGEIALMSPKPDAAKAEDVFRARARGRASATSEILGTPRRNEPRAPLARPGQAAASSRTACSGLRLVHGGFDTLDLKEAKALLEELAA